MTRANDSVVRFQRVWYAKAFAREFVLFYPVYALYMADLGIGPATYGWLLFLWSLTVLIAELPSGVLADRLSRRSLLVVGSVLRGAGFMTWWLWPDLTGFAIGFVLWGLGSAAESGANEALLYETLADLDAGGLLERVLGRGEAWGALAVVLALALGGWLAASGIDWVAVSSAGAMLIHGVIVSTLLVEPSRSAAGKQDTALEIVRDARRTVSGSAVVRRALLVCIGVVTFFGALDEFFAPLLGDVFAADTQHAGDRLELGQVGVTLAGLYLLASRLDWRQTFLWAAAVGLLIVLSAAVFRARW